MPCSNAPESNNIIQKRLAFDHDWSGTVADLWAESALRSCPAGSIANAGLRWCGASRHQPSGDLDAKVCQEVRVPRQSSSKSPNAVVTKPLQETAQPTAPTSKQAQVIAMLQSTSGATIAAMMQQTGWQQHSVRGFLAEVVRKRLRLKLNSMKVDGDRVYRVDHGTEAEATGKKTKRRAA